MKLSPRSRLVMIGDSVTDCDRARPVGEGEPEALGHGYVAEIAALLMAVYPARSIRVTNMGIGGNTVRDLAARWDTDVLALKSDWLSVMIGINDVWRHFDDDDARQHLRAIKDLATGLVPGVGVDVASITTVLALRKRHRPSEELKGALGSLDSFIDADVLV